MDAVRYVRDLIAAARRQDGFCLEVLVPKEVFLRLPASHPSEDPLDPFNRSVIGVRVGPILDG